MAKKNLIREQKNTSSDSITIKKKTILNFVLFIPILFLAYRMDQKLDFLMQQVQNNNQEILILKNQISQMPINVIVSLQKVSPIFSFLEQNLLNITLVLFSLGGLCILGHMVVTAIVGSGTYRAFTVVDGALGDVAVGSQNLAIAANNSAQGWFSYFNATNSRVVESQVSSLNSVSNIPNSSSKDTILISNISSNASPNINVLNENSLLPPNINLGTQEFPVSSRIDIVLDPEHATRLNDLESTAFGLIDAFFNS